MEVQPTVLGPDNETGGYSRFYEYEDVGAILDQMGGGYWDLVEVREQCEYPPSLRQQWPLLSRSTSQRVDSKRTLGNSALTLAF